MKPDTKVSTLLRHYSLVKTAGGLLGVTELGLARTATSMIPGFNL